MKCDIFVSGMLQSAVVVLVAGLQKGCFSIRGKQNKGRFFFKLRNSVVPGGKLLHALVQRSRSKQHNVLGVAAACAAGPCIH